MRTGRELTGESVPGNQAARSRPVAARQGWHDRVGALLSHPHRADLLGLTFLLCVTGTVILKFLIRDAWMIRTDLLAAYVPFYTFLGEQLRSGSLPGWSPFQAGGLPFAGDPQSGWMYVPAMFWYAVLPPIAATKAMAASHVLIAVFSSYAFARLLGLRVIASLVGAIGFALAAHVYHSTYCCTIWSQLATWIPVGLLGIEIAARPWPLRYRAGGCALAGIAISQMAAGWVGQGIYNGLLIVGGYVFYRTVISPIGSATTTRERLRRLLAVGGATLLLGLGLAAGGLLPRLDAARESPIGAGNYEQIAGSSRDRGWAPERLFAQLLDTESTERGPRLTHEVNRRYYAGGFVASLALVAPFMARRRFAAPFFTAVVIIILVLVLKETPLHRIFYLLPRYQELHEHAPFRLLGLLFFFAAMLAATAVESLHDWARSRWVGPIAVVPLLVIFWIDNIVSAAGEQVGKPVIEAAVVVSAILAATAIAARMAPRIGRARTERIYTLLQLLLLLGVLWDPVVRQLIRDDLTSRPLPPDLAAAVVSALADTDPGGAGEFLQAQLAQSDAPFRYFGYDGSRLRTAAPASGVTYHGRISQPAIRALLIGAQATQLGLYDIQGYNPVQFQGYVDFQTAINQGVAQNYHDANVLRTGIGSPLIDLLNVRYIIVPRAVPPGRPDLLRLSQLYPTVFQNSLVRVLENPNAAPFSWIVHNVRIAPREEALGLLASGAADPLDVALVDEPIPGFTPSATGRDVVTLQRYEPNRIDLTAQSETGGLLILNEINATGWHAYVNGERVTVHTVNGLQRGVLLPAGTSVVRFSYEPHSLRVGVAISGLAIVAILAIAWMLVIPLLPFTRRAAAAHRRASGANSGHAAQRSDQPG